VTTVFADSFYFLAVLNRCDQHHQRAQDYAARQDLSVVTTRAVLLEVGDAFADSATRTAAAGFLKRLERNPGTEIVALDDDLYARGLALYRDRPDKEWGLTDCISFVVMKDRGITEALTGDRHFAQAGFVPLLAQS